VKPNLVEALPNGLEGIEAGHALLKEGKISAKKLVYTVSETPGL
jgi:NADPH2:quinone reductase